MNFIPSNQVKNTLEESRYITVIVYNQEVSLSMLIQRVYNKVQTPGYTKPGRVSLDFARKKSCTGV